MQARYELELRRKNGCGAGHSGPCQPGCTCDAALARIAASDTTQTADKEPVCDYCHEPYGEHAAADIGCPSPTSATVYSKTHKFRHTCSAPTEAFIPAPREMKEAAQRALKGTKVAPAVTAKPDHEQFEAWCLEYFGKNPNEVRFDSERGPFIMGDLIAAFLAGSKYVSRPATSGGEDDQG